MPVLDIVFTILAVLAIVVFWAALFDSNRFVVRRHQIADNRIKKSFRAIVLADLHNASFGVDNERLLAAIAAEKPDMIFIPGDMITAKAKDGKSRAYKLLKELSGQYPVYYSCGNHEARVLKMDIYREKGKEFSAFIDETGIRLLRNTKASVEDYGVVVAGLEIDSSFFGRLKRKSMPDTYLKDLLGEADSSRYTVLLAHNPDYFEKYALWNPDLVLAGHNHGGIIRVPFWGKGVISPAAQIFPKYDGGIFTEGRSQMVLSRGLGIHTIPFRIFNPGEIWVIDFGTGKSLEKE